MWFETLTGFREQDFTDVASQFEVDGSRLISKHNGRVMRRGRFELVSLAELRRRSELVPPAGQLTTREVVADVQQLHLQQANAGALFQVASQFNTLEMSAPSITPEQGIDRYEADRTQGPACAVACGAGTIHRNYLVEFDGHRGQSANHQLDGLAPLADALGVDIVMENGYAFPTGAQLAAIAETLGAATAAERGALMGLLQIGLMTGTEVTLPGGGHLVTQAYCSALPVAYADLPADRWEPFARLVLDAAYEATLLAAVVNADQTGNRRVFLTLLGGGVFGNNTAWILDAIRRSLKRLPNSGINVTMVSHGRTNPEILPLLADF